MAITAKELAQKLGLSATAVSMALNNKPGVSTQTRKEIIKAAEKYGYDFTKLSLKKNKAGDIYCIIYKSHNAILKYTPIFSELTDGIGQYCENEGYHLKLVQMNEHIDNVQKWLEDIRVANCAGIILLGTEIGINAAKGFAALPIPVVLLDTYFDALNCSSVLINNKQGAYLATNYLISRYNKQPGHLCSSYRIENFEARKNGFNKAIREHGMSTSKSITHELPPSIEGAFADMLDYINSATPLAECYFADNDLIAIGAMKALKLRGYKIPEDIAIVGFDNIHESHIIEPSLTTIDIPREFMGQTAARQLIYQISNPAAHPVTIEVSTRIIKRFSA